MTYKLLRISVFVFFALATQITFAQKYGSDHLITLDQLKSYSENQYVLLHIAKSEDYATGHIPNALNVTRDFITDTTLEYGGIMGADSQIESLLGRLGVHRRDKIILYDDKGGCDATRLWWILRYYGHHNTALLDGGLQAWRDENLEISTEDPILEPSNYRFPDEPNIALYASLADVQSVIDDSNAVLLDVRTLGEFSGDSQKKGAFRKGRIPTSILMDWAALINYKGDKKLKSREDLRKIFNALGITKDKRIIVYCQSGVRSSHTTFVLSEILGYENVSNYDGSWIEWSFDSSLPIETGAIPVEEDKEETPASDYWWLAILPLAAGLFYLNRRNLRK